MSTNLKERNSNNLKERNLTTHLSKKPESSSSKVESVLLNSNSSQSNYQEYDAKI